MNRWPTMPVAPRIPTGSLFDMISCDFIPAKFRQGIPPVIRRRIRCAWPPLSRGTQEYDPRCLFDSRSGSDALLRSDYVRTPPEVLRVPASMDVPWHARVVPNKFAALSREAQPTRTVQRLRRPVNGFGVHDVIVETPEHSQVMALMSDSFVTEILNIYKTRYDELSLDPRIALITIFKNHGI